MPALFGGLVTASQHDAYVDQSTFGGYTLAQHAENASTLAKISERVWDHVVLQEHSLFPVIGHYRENWFYPAARTLDSLIAMGGSGTTFFMTWGREFGGEYCIGEHCSPDYPDFFAMQADVSSAYGQIATELAAFLVPVGNLWAVALHEDPGSPLWHPDHYHPGPEGSYLAACVFYARFFDESPEGLLFFGTIDPARALFYQQIAGRLVTTGAASEPEPPARLRLLPPHPNPFNPRCALVLDLPAESAAVLDIHAPTGRRVDHLDLGVLPAGRHRVFWDAGDAPAGVYLCRLCAGGKAVTRKLTLLR